MTAPFGQTPRRRKMAPNNRIVAAICVAAAVLGAGGVALLVTLENNNKRAEAEGWMEQGPPCPVMSLSAPEAADAQKMANFLGVRFARRSMDVACSGVQDKDGLGHNTLPVCQFNGPEVLVVTTSKGQFAFGPTLFSPTTVSVEAGAPRCVINADHNYAGMNQ